MAFPQWQAGQIVTADGLNDRVVRAAYASTLQALTSSTAVDITELSVPVAANTVYELGGRLLYAALSGADPSFLWSVPAGATMPWNLQGMAADITSGTSYYTVHQAADAGVGITVGGTNSAGVSLAAVPTGLLTVGSTGGTLQLRGLRVGTGTATLVTGSYITLRAIAQA